MQGGPNVAAPLWKVFPYRPTKDAMRFKQICFGGGKPTEILFCCGGVGVGKFRDWQGIIATGITAF